MPDPGNWGDASAWAGHFSGGDSTPAVGSVAWFSYDHVAYVDQVSGGQVHIIADNYSASYGYTDSGWIAASSVNAFLHPFDLVPVAPTQLSGQVHSNRIDLSWAGSTGATSYQIIKNGIQYASVLAPSFTDTNLRRTNI